MRKAMYHALPEETDSQKGIGWGEYLAYLSNNLLLQTSSIEAVKRENEKFIDNQARSPGAQPEHAHAESK